MNLNGEEDKLSSRELARKASREILKAQNDTSGGGVVSLHFF